MLIDAHAHLDKYGDDLKLALNEIQDHRVFTIAVAMDVPSYKRSLEIGDLSELVLPTFGVHPKRAPDYADRLRELGSFIEETRIIGEIGLDFHWVKDSSQYAAQQKVLKYFLAAATEQNKIVNLHTKGAEKEILDLLERYDIKRAIVHWYSGPLDILTAMVQFGAYFTIGIEVLQSQHIQKIARQVPNDLLLTETDNPGGLKWLSGRVGMPGDIRKVVETVAELRGTSFESVARAAHANLLRLFKDDPWLENTLSHLWLP